MKPTRTAVLSLALAGLLAFSGLSLTAAPAVPLKVTREASTIWTYNTNSIETAEAVTTDGEKKTTYNWKFEKDTTSRMYFKDKVNKKWEILLVERDSKKTLHEYKTDGVDETKKKAPVYQVIGGPTVFMGTGNFLGRIDTAGKLSDKEWEKAVISHLRNVDPNNFVSGAKYEGKVVVAGKEVGEYKLSAGGLTFKQQGGPSHRNWIVRGDLTAKNPDTGVEIKVTNYTSTWSKGKNVPTFENFNLYLNYTKGNTAYKIHRKMERATQGGPTPLTILNAIQSTMMDAQFRELKKAYDAIKASNFTAKAIMSKKVDSDKIREAGKAFFIAYRQWSEGPFAEHILLWAENINLLTGGDVMGAAVGRPAPPVFAAKWYNTQPIPPSYLVGKVVVVEIFSPDCPPCRTSAKHLASLQNTYRKDGLVVIGLTNLAYAAANKKRGYTIEDIINKFGASYPIAADASTFVVFDVSGKPIWSSRGLVKMPRTTPNYRPQRGIPHAFLIDRKGIVRWRGHPMKIDAMLKTLLAEKP